MSQKLSMFFDGEFHVVAHDVLEAVDIVKEYTGMSSIKNFNEFELTNPIILEDVDGKEESKKVCDWILENMDHPGILAEKFILADN